MSEPKLLRAIYVDDDNNVDLSHIITHWMPIPGLPKDS